MKNILLIIFFFVNNLYSYQMYLLNGPSGIGAIKMMRDYKAIDINILNAPNNILSLIIKEQVDIAAIPSNMAAIIFNRNLPYKAVAVISETKLFIISSKKDIQTLKDLKNKTIYCGAKLATPDFMLQYLISKEKIQNININYSFSNMDLAKAIASENIDIAILPEPFVSSAILENMNLHIVIDMSKYVENYPAAILIAKNTFIYENNILLKEVLNEYKKSTEYILNNEKEIDSLLKDSNLLINASAIKYGLNRIGLTFYDGAKMKFYLNSYYTFLNNFDKKLIGGKIPTDDFYYIE